MTSDNDAAIKALVSLTTKEVPEVEKKFNGDLGGLLDGTQSMYQKYIIMDEEESTALTLWTALSYCYEAFEVSPYMLVTSAEKRSGKTRVIEISEMLVWKARPTTNISPAALAHIAEAGATMLIDEVDTILNSRGEMADSIRGMLNARHKKTGVYIRMVGANAKMEPKEFNVFGPTLLAGIGGVPDTIDDRSIPIRMVRKLGAQRLPRFRAALVAKEAEPLREQYNLWGPENSDKLRSMYPELIDKLDDRAMDCWEPLLAIADLAGGKWPALAHKSALKLSVKAEDESPRVLLLRDIKGIFDKEVQDTGLDRMHSKTLRTALNNLDESPWGDMFQKQGISQNYIAAQLKEFGIKSKQFRIGMDNLKGYVFDHFSEAFNRYVIDHPSDEETSDTPKQPDTDDAYPQSETSFVLNETHSTNETAASHDVSDVSNVSAIGEGGKLAW